MDSTRAAPADLLTPQPGAPVTEPVAPVPSAGLLGPHHVVHRPDTPEAFLLDSTAPVRQSFAFSAELPRDHRLFCDSLAPFHDLLFAVEALRETALFATSQYFRVPANRHTLVTSGEAEITEVQPWRRTDGVDQIALDLDLTPTDVVNGVPRGMECRAAVSIGGVSCGTARARLLLLMPGAYRNHRRLGRQESERTTAGLPTTAGPGEPTPYQVGRRSARNVLIGLPVEGEESLTFRVATDSATDVLPGAADEVPASLFVEVARQAALFAATELHGFVPSHALLTRWQAAFLGYAEPGLPLHCTVRLPEDATDRALSRDPAGRPVAALEILFAQGARAVARASVTVTVDC